MNVSTPKYPIAHSTDAISLPEPSGYEFELSVAVNRITVALVRVKAETFAEAKQKVETLLRVEQGDQMLPVIDLH